MAVISGRALSWLIFPTPAIICLPFNLKILTLICCLIGGVSGYLISNVSLLFNNKSLQNYFFSFFVGGIWFIIINSTIGIIFYPLKRGWLVVKSFDQGWREYLGGQIIYQSLKKGSFYNQIFQNNNLKIYLISFIFWLIILLGFIRIYLNSLYLEHYIEDIMEVIVTFK